MRAADWMALSTASLASKPPGSSRHKLMIPRYSPAVQAVHRAEATSVAAQKLCPMKATVRHISSGIQRKKQSGKHRASQQFFHAYMDARGRYRYAAPTCMPAGLHVQCGVACIMHGQRIHSSSEVDRPPPALHHAPPAASLRCATLADGDSGLTVENELRRLRPWPPGGERPKALRPRAEPNADASVGDEPPTDRLPSFVCVATMPVPLPLCGLIMPPGQPGLPAAAAAAAAAASAAPHACSAAAAR